VRTFFSSIGIDGKMGWGAFVKIILNDSRLYMLVYTPGRQGLVMVWGHGKPLQCNEDSQDVLKTGKKKYKMPLGEAHGKTLICEGKSDKRTIGTRKGGS